MGGEEGATSLAGPSDPLASAGASWRFNSPLVEPLRERRRAYDDAVSDAIFASSASTAMFWKMSRDIGLDKIDQIEGPKKVS